MKRLLMASAAAVALALAAPLAGAQDTQPLPTTPYETQQANPSDPGMTDPMAPPTTQAQPYSSTTQTQPYSSTAQSPSYSTTTQTQTYSNTTPTQPYSTTTQNQPYPTTAQTQPYPGAAQTQAYPGAAQPGASHAQTHQSYDSTTGASASSQAQTPYGSQRYAMTENTLTDADLVQVAMDAGMPGVPMTAAEVCAPRQVSLGRNTSRLNRDARRRLIHAADHASVCEMQRLVIKSPDGRGAALHQTLVEHGVDESMITVEDSAGELGVEMAFSGVATSSEYYAQMFNQPQFAANTAARPNQYDPATGQYAPSPAPNTSGQYAPGAAPTTPNPYAPGATSPNADPYADEPSEDTTSGYRETSATRADQPIAEPISYEPYPDGAPIQ
jgi:hypothetical protein